MHDERPPTPYRERPFYYAHFVYRLFDFDGVLIYVGSTGDVRARIRQHLERQPWWPSVDRVTVEVYPHRSAAEEAEQAAITDERPWANIQRPRAHRIEDYQIRCMQTDASTRNSRLNRQRLADSEEYKVVAALGSFRSGATRRTIARRAGVDATKTGRILAGLRDAGAAEQVEGTAFWRAC